jgi:hypothetical protein
LLDVCLEAEPIDLATEGFPPRASCQRNCGIRVHRPIKNYFAHESPPTGEEHFQDDAPKPSEMLYERAGMSEQSSRSGPGNQTGTQRCKAATKSDFTTETRRSQSKTRKFEFRNSKFFNFPSYAVVRKNPFMLRGRQHERDGVIDNSIT